MRYARYVMFAALALALVAVPSSALAAEDVSQPDAVRYVVDNEPVDGLRVSVDAVSSGLASLSDELDSRADTLDEELSGIADAQSAQSEALSLQSESLDAIAAAVDAQTQAQEVGRLSFGQVLSLVPEDAPAGVADYMRYPFVWGVSAGLFAWVITFVWESLVRLLGLVR